MQWGLFSPKGLRSIDESTARLNIWHGAVRSSKTVCSEVRWLEYIKTAPPGDLLMIGKTERTLERNILNPLSEIVGPSRFRHNKGQGEVYIFGRRIYTAGANDERSSEKIRGMTLVGAYGDEVTLWPESMFKELLNRLSARGAKFFGTTNPDGPFHWLKKGYLDRAHELDLKAWHFTLDDNPNLDPAYVASLKTEHTGLWYKRMIDGLWVMAEGAIYDQFDPDVHCYDVLPGVPDSYDLSLDYGTQNAFVALLTANIGDRSFIEREYYYSGRDSQRQKTDAEYSKALKEWLGDIRPRKTFYDPSAISFATQLRRDGFTGLQPANNDVLDGIRCVSNRLSNGKLLVHRTQCPNTVREFNSYAWDQKACERGEDKPLKVNDHAMDACRYHEFSLYGRGTAKAAASGVQLF